jgi:tRNA modification GTPase
MEQTAVKDPAGSPYSGIPVRSVSEAELELAAQSQTLSRIESADILLWCQPVSEVGAIRTAKWRPDVRQATQIIQVATKADQAEAGVLPAEWVGTSAKSGWGVDLLLARIADTAANAGWGAGEVMPVTAVRCAEQVQLMVEALDRAHLAAAEGWGEELVAAELRVALDNLGQIAGTVYNDEILGRIFSRFCIGK